MSDPENPETTPAPQTPAPPPAAETPPAAPAAPPESPPGQAPAPAGQPGPRDRPADRSRRGPRPTGATPRHIPVPALTDEQPFGAAAPNLRDLDREIEHDLQEALAGLPEQDLYGAAATPQRG